MPFSHRRLDPQIPVLIFALVSAQSAAVAVTATVGDAGFAALAHLLLLAAFALALGNLRWKLPLQTLAYSGLVIAAVLFSLRTTSAPLVNLLFPGRGLSDPNEVLAVLLVWLMLGFSLLQYRHDMLIFISACGLAIFGLIGVINLEPGLLVAFVIYLFATILAWSYQTVAMRSPELTSRLWWRVVRSQAVTGASVLAAVLLAAAGVSAVLYHTVPSPYGQPGRWRPMWTWAGALLQGNFFLSRELPVGNGPAYLSQQVLFRARADYPTLWQVAGYDHYDGRVWSQGANTRTRLQKLERNHFMVAGTSYVGQRINRQEFEVVAASTNAVLGSAHPVEVSFVPNPWAPARGLVIADDYGCLVVSPVTPPGGKYNVVSVMPEEDPTLLRAAGQYYPAEIRRRYIDDVPLAAQERLGELARQITQNAETPYDKVTAVLSYLENRCYYTQKPPVTPLTEDAAAYFVLKSRRGACDLFATATAVMLRLSGVPVRLASGFIEGEWDRQSNSYLVRAAHAHAWVQVYFPRYGWVPFNPSPERSLEDQSLWSLLRRGQSNYAVGRIAKQASLVLLGLGLLLLIAMFVADPRLLRARWLDWRAAREPWEHAARECRRAVLALAATVHLSPPRGQPPLEILFRAEATGRLPAAAPLARLRELTTQFYALRFSPRSAPVERLGPLAREFADLTGRIRRRRW